jgi:hypothetical protein
MRRAIRPLPSAIPLPLGCDLAELRRGTPKRKTRESGGHKR